MLANVLAAITYWSMTQFSTLAVAFWKLVPLHLSSPRGLAQVSLFNKQQEGWRRGNSSRLSLHLKKCKVEGVRLQTNGSSTLTRFLLHALGHSCKMTSSWTTGLESNKICFGEDVFSISSPTPLFWSAAQICTLEASVAKLLLLNVKLKYTCYFLHLRHCRAFFLLL